MKIIIQEEDKVKAERLIKCDDAFNLLWDIDQMCRNYIKYGIEKEKSKEDLLQEIRDTILNSNLLELWG